MSSTEVEESIESPENSAGYSFSNKMFFVASDPYNGRHLLIVNALNFEHIPYYGVMPPHLAVISEDRDMGDTLLGAFSDTVNAMNIAS